MKLTIETKILQDLVNKAVKGAANNKYMEFTNWINIKAKDNLLTFITCDGANYFYVKHPITTDDFDIIVQVKDFASLVRLTTTKEITLTMNDGDKCLTFEGNGEYSIELPADAEFDDPLSEIELEEATATISKTLISNMITINKPSIAPTMTNPENTGYYVGDKIITTDTKRITALHENVLEKPILLTKSMVDLLNNIDDDEIDCYIINKQIIFKTDKYAIYGYSLNGIESFKITAINNLIESQIDECAVFNKENIMSALSRILIFVKNLDNTIILNFKKDYLTISTEDKQSQENVEYVQNTANEESTCKIKIDVLMSQINALNEESFAFYYGNSKYVKLTTDNITQIIALNL